MNRIDASTLERAADRLLRTFDLPAANSERVAESLVGANCCGHDSHGVSRIPQYGAMIADGVIDPGAAPSLALDEGNLLVVDGGSAFGHLVAREAVDRATEAAEASGVSVVGLRDASHLGRIGEWAERTAERGYLFAAFVSSQGGSPIVAPAGSARGRFSTNPIAIGVPTFDALPFPLVLDMATSQVANGKIDRLRANDEPLPEGWAVDANGEPILDPNAVGGLGDDAGAILPLGGTVAGYKGYGLSVMSILLSAILSGGDVPGGQDGRTWFNNVAGFVVIDPTRFTTRAEIESKVTTLAEYVRETDFDDGVSLGPGAKGEETLLPGEAEHLTRLERDADGVPISDADLQALREFAGERGVDDDAFLHGVDR